MAISEHDKKYLSQSQIDAMKQSDADVAAGLKTQAEGHAFSEGYRNAAGYSGGEDGSQYIPLANRMQNTETPTYNIEYRDKQNDAVNNYANMSFANWKQGDEYKSLVDSYTRQGQKVMQDVLGQVSSRTGGLASSYATTASQQQYNDFMAQLESVAREMYSSDKNDMYNLANLYGNMDQTEWSRYQDNLNQANYINQTNYDRNWNENQRDYDRDQDRLDREAAEEDKAYNRDQAARTEGKALLYDLIDSNATLEQIPQSVKEAAGLTDDIIAILIEGHNNPQMTQDQAQAWVAFDIDLGMTWDQIDPDIRAKSGYSDAEGQAMRNKYLQDNGLVGTSSSYSGGGGYSGGSSGNYSSGGGYSGGGGGGTGDDDDDEESDDNHVFVVSGQAGDYVQVIGMPFMYTYDQVEYMENAGIVEEVWRNVNGQQTVTFQKKQK